jgi:ABC-type polysaccharide/polyol phosphate export permease
MSMALRPGTDLLVELVRRDTRLRYRRSVLGIVWSQISSLAVLAVLTVVFTRVVPLGIEHYAAFVYAGLLGWRLFQSSLVSATGSVVAARDLARRPGFNVTLLPLAAVASQLLQYALALPALLAAVVLTTGRLPWTVVVLPALVATVVLVVLGPAYLLARLEVRYRDTGHLLGVVLLPLFYATPVFYSPDAAGRSFAWIYRWNPLARVFAATRGALLEGRLVDMGAVVGIALVAAVVAVVAARNFAAHAHEYGEAL